MVRDIRRSRFSTASLAVAELKLGLTGNVFSLFETFSTAFWLWPN